MKTQILVHQLSIITLLLIAAFATVPYGYYTVMRWGILIITVYLLFNSNPSIAWIIPIAVAVAFNPIFPLHNTKETWFIFDLLGAGLYTIWVLTSLLKSDKNL